MKRAPHTPAAMALFRPTIVSHRRAGSAVAGPAKRPVDREASDPDPRERLSPDALFVIYCF